MRTPGHSARGGGRSHPLHFSRDGVFLHSEVERSIGVWPVSLGVGVPA